MWPNWHPFDELTPIHILALFLEFLFMYTLNNKMGIIEKPYTIQQIPAQSATRPEIPTQFLDRTGRDIELGDA